MGSDGIAVPRDGDEHDADADMRLDFFCDLRPWRHWSLRVHGAVATLSMQVQPDASVFEGCELKLNSYDIGVDLELADAVRRIRFEHPGVACVVITSGIDGVFCAGANINMLARADHAHKVNFCKFTNETRLEMEEASANSGIAFLAAVNGACSGGGYELALACDHILLIDDRSTAVSLPEVPLLGVLPGTGGLTRLTDKRHVRRDRADVFATRAEGMRGAEALEWGLVDELARPTQWDEAVASRAAALAAEGPSRPASAPEAGLPAIEASVTNEAIVGRWVRVGFDRERRCAELSVLAGNDPRWPLEAALELDAVLCHLRFNEPAIGTLLLCAWGDHLDVLAHEAALCDPRTHHQRETGLLWARVLRRLDLTARTLIAAVEPGSCFAGVLAELALAADRTYMLDGVFVDPPEPDGIGALARRDRTDADAPAAFTLTEANLGVFPTANGITRLRSRLWGDKTAVVAVEKGIWDGSGPLRLDAQQAHDLGVVTAIPDDLDWDDELRLAIDERASFSPDALTAMEANHRFCGPETMATKIFGRLSAWQNWIFTRPNAAGPTSALARYGTGARPQYDPTRT